MSTYYDITRQGGAKLNQNGRIKINLGQLLKESGLSKNKFCQKAEIQRSQLNGYMNNTITRLDTEVLVRICRTLNCSIADLLEYIPPDEK
ncbi:helix-turn-helix transcriptional regulator [uncultured Phocaeicola sp.]|uniref:helix-turn-helix domain-containing protein n=1 Tax=uncultured Phocaeicola sp. TaxID=990718 RepID=UPI0025AE267F|nr:helix-turn-helix transcriptional regulator [uncultured Phocaeicola sp.]